MIKTEKLSVAVLEILNKSRIEGNKLFLPNEQLSRPLYEEVNKALTLLGGKWNRGAKAHIFDSDPRAKFTQTVEEEEIIDVKKTNQAYYTPKSLAAQVVEIADISEHHYILEPSVGQGALVSAAIEAGADPNKIIGVDIDDKSLALKDKVEVKIEDFLKIKSFSRRFDRIIMNPPFTRNQDVEHVRHAMSFLSDSGVLVSIMAGNTTRSKFVRLLEDSNYEIIQVEKGAFKESGTMVNTIILKIRK